MNGGLERLTVMQSMLAMNEKFWFIIVGGRGVC